MNARFLRRGAGVSIFLAASISWPIASGGSTLTWDSSGDNPRNPTNGDGVWDNSGAFWSNGVSDVPWVSGDTAVFGNNGASGTVTLTSPIAAGEIFTSAVGTGPVIAAAGGNMLTLDGPTPTFSLGGPLTISASIGGVNGLTVDKDIVGARRTTLILSGSNTYSGGTTLNESYLYVSNTEGSATGSGPVTTDSVLGGSGTIAGPVTIRTGGTLGPDLSIVGMPSGNTLTINNDLTMAPGTNLYFDLGNPAGDANNDQVMIAGNLTINPNVSVTVGAISYGTFPLIHFNTVTDNSNSFSGWTVSDDISSVFAPGTTPHMEIANNALSYVVPPAPIPAAPSESVYVPPRQNPVPLDPTAPSPFLAFTQNVINNTGAPQSQINIVVDGNYTRNVTGVYDAFPGGTNISSSYDPTTSLTTISITPKVAGQVVAAGATVHVGYSILGIGPLGGGPETILDYWGVSQSSPSASDQLIGPSFYVTNPGQGPNSEFVIIYSTIEMSNGVTAGEWSEQQVVAGQCFQVGLQNDDYSDGNWYPFDVSYKLSSTEIPLDDLNSVYEPLTSFLPMPGFSNGTGTKFAEQWDSILAPSVPEPACIGLLAVGVLGVTKRPKR